MCLSKTIQTDLKRIKRIFNAQSQAKKFVLSAIFAAFAAIMHFAGSFLPGIGYLVISFSTLPILFATIISYKHGLLSYLITIVLLAFFGLSELFIFPFTTGLLGLTIGWGLTVLKHHGRIIVLSGITLFIGICVLIYIIGIPILGPVVPAVSGSSELLIILGFSLIYSFLLLCFCIYFIKKISKFL